jgi:hypothetical protein
MAGHSAEGVRERWIALGLSTRPVDKTLAEKKLTGAYLYAGLTPPKKFLWFPSPVSALIALGTLQADERTKMLVTDGIRHQIHNEVFQNAIAIQDRFQKKVAGGMGREVLVRVRDQVLTRVRSLILRELADQTDGVGKAMRMFESRVGEEVYQTVTAGARKLGLDFESLERDSSFDLDEIMASLRHCQWGWSEDYWLAACEACMRESNIQPMMEDLNRFVSLVQVREQLSIFFPFADLVLCSENPVVLKRDERDRLHSAEGPALAYRDGWGIWAWHGTRVPKNVIEHPKKITVSQIETEMNAEVRRVMVERMGWERFIREGSLRPVQSDDWGTLYRKDLIGDPEPLMLVKVTNSTPEPDGSYKDYVLRVHHELRPLMEGNILGEPQKLTALNAIASTFGLRGDEYKKVIVQT